VGLNTIVEAIRQDGPVSVDAVGVARRADTNCGSCLPELDRIVRRELASKAA
jgi:assimilatory nitrate reductase catalytic subunit